jgi:hypothetical protein
MPSEFISVPEILFNGELRRIAPDMRKDSIRRLQASAVPIWP